MSDSSAAVPIDRCARVLDDLVGQVERAEVLDKPADVLAGALAVLAKRPLRDLLSGTPVAHPVHPALVAIPIGSWTTASVLDLLREPAAARKAVAFGLLTAIPTAVTGLNDWSDTSGAERRVGLAHALANSVALGLYAGSYLARRRGRNLRGAALAAVGSGVLTVGGWLGGHLAYARGVGVDTTVFQEGTAEWTDVLAATDLPSVGAMVQVDAGGVPVVLINSRDGLRALADRCTHRGGPLHEGRLEDGCVICPLHGSGFDVSDGAVARGPASRPEPKYEVRVEDGRVQVRRDDQAYSLRTGPVGV